MKMTKEVLDKIAVYDKATGQIKASTFLPADITRIVMRNTNDPIDPSQLFA